MRTTGRFMLATFFTCPTKCGLISQSGPSFWDPLHAAFSAHARMDFAAACQVVPGKLGADAPLLGAAAFVLDGDRYGWDADAPPRQAGRG